MPRFNKRHTITRSQLDEKAARRGRRPGGRRQKKGTKPYEHQLSGKAGFVPMPTVESILGTHVGGIPIRPRVPDLRCPKCDSSRMGKERLKKCPECGYEGEPVDINKEKEGGKADV